MRVTSRIAVALLACLPCAIAAAAPAQAIAIDKFAFVPKEITVAPGTTVTWTNHDQTPHLLVAQDKSFKSQALDTDDSYRFTFVREGDFGYFCTMHPFMTGIVHVRDPNAAAAHR